VGFYILEQLNLLVVQTAFFVQCVV